MLAASVWWSPRYTHAQTSNPDREAYFDETHVHTSWSLDAFNIGVEVGQLAFIGAVLGALWLGRRLTHLRTVTQYVEQATPYAIGALGGFWFVDRSIAVSMMSTLQAPGTFGTELNAPEPDGFIADSDASFS